MLVCYLLRSQLHDKLEYIYKSFGKQYSVSTNTSTNEDTTNTNNNRNIIPIQEFLMILRDTPWTYLLNDYDDNNDIVATTTPIDGSNSSGRTKIPSETDKGAFDINRLAVLQHNQFQPASFS